MNIFFNWFAVFTLCLFSYAASKVNPLHLEYFNFAGRMIGLALMHKMQIGIVLDRVLFLQLAGLDVSLEDIKDADPFLYSSCKQILKMDSEYIDSDALGLTFVREVEELGPMRVVDLCPGGKDIVVDSKNRNDYVNLLIKHRFVTSISEQVSNFANGFTDIISSRLLTVFFRSLDLEDLDRMLRGRGNDISLEDWRAHTVYNGYKESDPQILWFWKVFVLVHFSLKFAIYIAMTPCICTFLSEQHLYLFLCYIKYPGRWFPCSIYIIYVQ